MTSMTQTRERRSDRRSRCLKGARVVLANGNSTLTCRIRNQSVAGVRINTDETGYVPQSFTLVPDGSTVGRICRVAWRSRTEVGAVSVATTELAKRGFNGPTAAVNRRDRIPVDRYPV